MSNITRITGGRRGFVAAIDEAFSARSLHNPEVRYSHSRGFHVESGMVPADDNVVWQAEACYRADDNGRRCPRSADYSAVRREILAAE